uniref:Uncharacterized protein n=1 Tax=uncultured Bacillota bacterium TaxID=344338 RepID=A0A650ENJ7_9FIRM|nr:hypothetical protein Firmicute1046_0780 [uncultured Firmicutes bacterium]
MKKKTLRIKKTALTLILSAGLLSSLAVGNTAAAEQSGVPVTKLYFVSPHDKNTAKLALIEKNKKKNANKNFDELLADMIGADAEKIRRERGNGKSLEEIATEHGVADDFRAAVMQKRNSQLEDLFRRGRISGKEFAEMYDNSDFIAVPAYEKQHHAKPNRQTDTGGDVAVLLAEVLGEAQETVQERLSAGETPWEIAQEAGRFSEYKDAVLEHLISTLDERVASGSLTREEADEYIADFEFEFAAM